MWAEPLKTGGGADLTPSPLHVHPHRIDLSSRGGLEGGQEVREQRKSGEQQGPDCLPLVPVSSRLFSCASRPLCFQPGSGSCSLCRGGPETLVSGPGFHLGLLWECS